MGADSHPQDKLYACVETLWDSSGNCFCAKPIMHVLDRFGEVDLVYLTSAVLLPWWIFRCTYRWAWADRKTPLGEYFSFTRRGR